MSGAGQSRSTVPRAVVDSIDARRPCPDLLSPGAVRGTRGPLSGRQRRRWADFLEHRSEAQEVVPPTLRP
jgi:hypothetical protein